MYHLFSTWKMAIWPSPQVFLPWFPSARLDIGGAWAGLAGVATHGHLRNAEPDACREGVPRDLDMADMGIFWFGQSDMIEMEIKKIGQKPFFLVSLCNVLWLLSVFKWGTRNLIPPRLVEAKSREGQKLRRREMGLWRKVGKTIGRRSSIDFLGDVVHGFWSISSSF